MQTDDELYGIDWEGPVPTPRQNNVQVPDTTCPLSQQQLLAFQQEIDPMQSSALFGYDTYATALNFITELLGR
jgi:hypothetical protein